MVAEVRRTHESGARAAMTSVRHHTITTKPPPGPTPNPQRLDSLQPWDIYLLGEAARLAGLRMLSARNGA
jgi:hypothetical protein